MPWTPDAPETIDAVYERLRDFRAQYDRDENWIMGVFSPDDSRCLGGTGLHPRQGEGGVEIGYWIAADEVGRGYATELLGGPDARRVRVLRPRPHRDPGRSGKRALGAGPGKARLHEGGDAAATPPAEARLRPARRERLDDVPHGVAGSPVEAYGYTAYDALGRELARA